MKGDVSDLRGKYRMRFRGESKNIEYKQGLIDKWGTGIPRIIEESKEY